jgi:small subunit ribosomal protein S20
VRNVRTAVAAGDAAKAAELARVANRALDKAVSKGVIHKNQAANRKSAISLSVAAL